MPLFYVTFGRKVFAEHAEKSLGQQTVKIIVADDDEDYNICLIWNVPDVVAHVILIMPPRGRAAMPLTRAKEPKLTLCLY
jgi:hypothetical protein